MARHYLYLFACIMLAGAAPTNMGPASDQQQQQQQPLNIEQEELPDPTLVSTDAKNQDIVLAPQKFSPTDPQKLLIFIPGANVPTSNYNETMAAIQTAASAPGLGLSNLWVVVPAINTKKCIMYCPSASVCAPLHYIVSQAVAKAVAMGYKASLTSPDAFIAGHSLGGVCADTLARAYTKPPYNAALLMGSYPEPTTGNGSITQYPIAVLALGAELDGGLARVGKFATLMRAVDDAAHHQQRASPADKKSTAVVVLPGLDHSSFCPGFHVPGDVWPAEADASTALPAIGSVAAAFMSLHAQLPEPASASSSSAAVLAQAEDWTKELLGPMIEALELEVDEEASSHQSPWCETTQRVISGLDTDLESRLRLESIYKDDSHQWEHTRVGYNVTADKAVTVNVTGHNDPNTFTQSCIHAAKQLGCKMASADRIAQQLQLNETQYNTSRSCADANRQAVAVAEQMLLSSAAGTNTLKRWKAKGRPFCFGPDFEPLGKIGPLFVDGSMTYKDNGTCLEVASIAISNTIKTTIFPGVHYCKVMSPARALDYIFTDSLKSVSGCLNV